MLASFLEIQPASPAPAAAPTAAPAKAPEPPAPVSESVSARNLAGSLPD
ncbi:plasmid stabilization protein, partial [Klebsiella pneumoniae]|nr:plasmid stabilization protein [Klebsiella pneumoniae]